MQVSGQFALQPRRLQLAAAGGAARLAAFLGKISAPLRWDTLAVFLHQAEPERREHVARWEVA